MRKFNDYIVEVLKDPAEAAAYLKASIDEYDRDMNAEAFLLAIRRVATARGGLSKLAKASQLSRQNLYRVLSPKGNPRLDTLELLLHNLGFKLSIESIPTIAS